VSDEQDEEQDPAYVVWEPGQIEVFECVEDAEHELMAMGSRGLRGTVLTCLVDAVSTLLGRHGIHAVGVTMNNDHRPEVRDFCGKYPTTWELSTSQVSSRYPRGSIFLLLRRQELPEDSDKLNFKDEFRLLYYDGVNAVQVFGCQLDALVATVTSKLTITGILHAQVKELEAKAAEQAAEIERLKGGGS
jgi:hypothetical protein